MKIETFLNQYPVPLATEKMEIFHSDACPKLVWGVSGSGKSRFALSSPSPIVIDLEGSTRLYAEQFDFYKAEVDKWGYIDPVRWNNFFNWINEQGLSEEPIPENTGFTNEYLEY